MSRKNKPFKHLFEHQGLWSFWIPLVSNVVISTASALMDISTKVYFLLLSVWAVLFIAAIAIGEIYKRSKEKRSDAEDAIAESLHIVVKAALENIDLAIVKRSFHEHKSNPNAQETKLSAGDRIRLIVSSLDYDLDDESISMIASNIIKGVSYEYLVESSGTNTLGLTKLRNGVCNRIKELKPDICDDDIQGYMATIKFYLHSKGKYSHNFTIMDRANQMDQDHNSYYFVKKEYSVSYLYEILLDTMPEIVDRLNDSYEELKNISVILEEKEANR